MPEPLFPYSYTNPQQFLQWTQIVAKPKVKLIHPLMLKRVEAMCRAAFAAGKNLGIGGSGRTWADQDALFRRRYHVDTTDLQPCRSGNYAYVGQCWHINDGVAAAAVPGVSYHEVTTPDGFALALDMIGDISWMTANCKKFGLYNFSSEPWHIQPKEVPASRRDYNSATHVIKDIPLPQPAAPAPPPPTSQPTPPAAIPVPVGPVVKGDTGTDVYLCQVILRHACSQTMVVPTGTFDAATEQAVKNVQIFFGITVDGRVGTKETWPVLNLCAQKTPPVAEDGSP